MPNTLVATRSQIARLTLGIALAAAVSLLAVNAFAQAFPDKPLRFIIGFGAGGPTDIVARTLAEQMSDAIGAKVVVETRAGASGNIATQAVATAPADGYTFLVAASPLAVNETLFRDFPVKYGRDLVAVAPIGATANVLVVNPRLGVRTLAEFTALARSRPGFVSYATLGSGSSSHLAGAAFDLGAGTKMEPIYYRAGNEALRDILGGDIHAWFATVPSVLESIRSGLLVALATTGPERSAWLPDLPTIAEAGLPGYDVRLWLGLFAPAGVPEDRLASVEQAVQRTLATPRMVQTFDSQGVASMPMSRAAFDGFVISEVKRWKAVVETLNLVAP